MHFKLISLVFAASMLSAFAQTTTAWNSLGCVAEGTIGGRHAFAGTATTSGNMTIENCLSSCSLNYAGLENGSQCFCSDTIMNNGASGTPISPNFCNVPCSGNDAEKCGGILSLTVYTRLAVPANGWITAGCYIDSNESRALRNASVETFSVNTEYCLNYCNTRGWKIAATQFGNQCFCGSTLLSGDNNAGRHANDADCSQACAANSGQTCGAARRMNLYVKA